MFAVEFAVGLAILSVVFIALAFFLVAIARKLLVNTVFGLIALLVINKLGAAYGVKIGITLLTVLTTAVLGLAGVGLMVLLNVAGVKL